MCPAAAIRAAKEAQADILAPELYRQATDWFRAARTEYKMKNFEEAREYARKARHYAEQAEFEVIRTGATPTEAPADNASPPPDTQANAPGPSDYATPTGTPVENATGTPSGGNQVPPDQNAMPGNPNPNPNAGSNTYPNANPGGGIPTTPTRP